MAKDVIEVAELLYLAILVLLILTGNILVILAFHMGSRRLRTYTNYFVVNLAVCDLMVGILSVPLWMYVRIDKSAYHNRGFYKAFLALDVLFGCGSISSLTVISIERMIAVKYPTVHFNLTLKPVAIAIVFIWAFSILFFVLNIVLGASKAFTTSVFVLGFILPTIVIFFNYVVIFRVARETVASTSRKLIKEMKVAKMVSIIIGLFLLCWLPFFIMNMLYLYYEPSARIPYALLLVTKALHYSNSMMNVIVYAVRSPEFRNAFKSLIWSKWKRAKSDSSAGLRTLRARTMTNGDSCVNDDTCNHCNGTIEKERPGTIPIEKRQAGSKLSEKFRKMSEADRKLCPNSKSVHTNGNTNTTPM